MDRVEQNAWYTHANLATNHTNMAHGSHHAVGWDLGLGHRFTDTLSSSTPSTVSAPRAATGVAGSYQPVLTSWVDPPCGARNNK